MPYAVILYFDTKTENTFIKIWKTIEKDNLATGILDSGIRPHITLAIYDDLNCQPCDGELAKISAKTASISLKFTHLGFFASPEPVIFAAPLTTVGLLDFHANLHTRLTSEAKNPWDLYQPGNWVPHCTLAMNFKVENMPEIIRRCLSLPLPMDASVIQMGVVEFQPVKDLFRYDLLSLG